MKNTEIKDIVSEILHQEKKHKLFEIKYKNKYPIWPFYRMYFYYGYLKYFNLIEKKRGFNKKKSLKTLLEIIKLLLNSKLFQLLIPKNKKYLIISTQRYVGGKEIYTKDLKNIIIDDYLEFSLSEQFNFVKGPIYLDFFKILFKLISAITYRFISISHSIEDFMNEMNVPKLFTYEFQRYRIEYYLWFSLFDIIIKVQKPQKIFIVAGVYYTPLIAIAEKHGIKTLEIQHGVINEYHLAYHFPDINRAGFYSNELLLLSDYWKNMANYPTGTKLVTLGNNFFSTPGSKQKTNNKHIVFISQPGLSNKLVNFLKINIDFFLQHNFEINYKLHPAEFCTWENDYPELKEMSDSKLINVITSNPPLKQLLSKSSIVIGISSTVIYESLDQNCKVFILDLPSSIYFEDLIEKGIVKKIDVKLQLSMDVLQFNSKNHEKFFSPTDIDTLKKITL